MPLLELSPLEEEIINAIRQPRVKEVVVGIQHGVIRTLTTTKSRIISESEFEFITKSKELKLSHSILFKRTSAKGIYYEKSVKKIFLADGSSKY